MAKLYKFYIDVCCLNRPFDRSQTLENIGCQLYDSFHIACAEASQADILLTTDDGLLKRAKRYNHQIQLPLNNPVIWLMDILSNTGDSDHDTD